MKRQADGVRSGPRRSRRRVAPFERLEPRLALAAAPVNPNSGSIVASQFQPYGYSLLGAQLLDVSASGGQSLQLTAPNNTGTPPAAPATYGYPQSAVNSGQITDSQVNVGGFTTLGMQLQDVVITGGALRVDVLDEGIGKPAAGGTQPVPSGGANTLPPLVPPGSPGGASNSGVIASSQFNDGGFGPLGIQASGLSVGGDLSIMSRTTLGMPDVPVPSPAVPFAPPLPGMAVNAGTIRDSQFADGGFGDTGLQLRSVQVGGSIDVGAERFLIQPTTGLGNLGPPTLVGVLSAKSKVVTFAKAAAGSPPPTSMLYPGMFVVGNGIPPKTVVQSIVNGRTIMLSRRPLKTGPKQLFFSTQDTGTNTGLIVSSQVADGGFGDIGMQWSNVTVGGRVATLHSGLEIQPELDNVGSITTGQKQFGVLGTPSFSATTPSGVPAPAARLAGAPGAAPGGGTSNDATNSGRIVASQFADGGFGDIGMQWQNVHVSGNVEATHNSLSVQPENTNQGLISVADVSFTTAPPVLAPSQASGGGPLPATPALVTQGTPVSPVLPVPTSPGRSGAGSNSASNSGLISRSQFADGGFGDVGLQWSNVTVRGDVQVVHNSLSIQPEGANLAGVSVHNVTFGSATAPAGDPRLAPATLASLTVPPSRSGPPPFVPNNAFARTSNVVNRINQQFSSGPAAATSLQWRSVTRDATGLVIVNNVLKVSNNGTAGKRPGAVAGTIRVKCITFPGRVPPRALAARPPASVQPVLLRGRAGSTGIAIPRIMRLNSATNSGTLSGNQFLDGGTGDIGLQWRDVTINGAVRIEHNSCSINVVGDAAATGPITLSGIRFATGWSASGAASDCLFLTPSAAGLAAAPKGIAASGAAGASNAAMLTGGQFLDGGMGQIGLQWQHVTINSPVRIVNNVFSINVSGTNTRDITVQNVAFT
jgi:hypothetical protein